MLQVESRIKNKATVDLSTTEFNYFSKASHPELTAHVGSFCEYNENIYYKEKCVGKGGYGVVYLFKSKTENLPAVVIKKEKKSFGKYYEAAAILNHATYSAIILGQGATAGDFDNTAEPHYALMPYIEGVPLNCLCLDTHRKRMSVYIAVLRAVNALHEKGIVHGDAQGRNIIINNDSKGEYCAVFIDYDLTRKIGDLAFQHDDRCDYAPELNGRHKPANPSQDIYCLGYTFLNILNDYKTDKNEFYGIEKKYSIGCCQKTQRADLQQHRQ